MPLKTNLYQNGIKRALDLVGAIIALALLSPVLGVVAIAVRVNLGTPILFTQVRPGLNEKPFKMLKFRSMTNRLDQFDDRPDEQRLTKFGRWIRATSLDELPSLLNVVMGSMSFVGPRPLLTEYLGLYSRTQQMRHTVRPGITGLAQVAGRNQIPWEDRFKLDVEYVESITFRSDMKIIFKTFGIVLRRVGISANSHATMNPFEGN